MYSSYPNFTTLQSNLVNVFHYFHKTSYLLDKKKTYMYKTRLSYRERKTPAMTYIKWISAFPAISYQCEIGFLGMPIKI